MHRVSSLPRADVQRTRGLRVTQIPRTIVDLVDAAGWEEVRGAVDALRWFSPAELRAAQRRAPGRAGRGLVPRLLEADEAHTKSELERRFLRFVRRHGLPRPTGLNVRVAGFKADCRYADERLVVELDGRAYHRAAGRWRPTGCATRATSSRATASSASCGTTSTRRRRRARPSAC